MKTDYSNGNISLHKAAVHDITEKCRRPRQVSFDRSLIACHSNQAIVREARRMAVFRAAWDWIMHPLSSLVAVIDVAHKTHKDVLHPPSAKQTEKENA